jgi:esterase/lipase
MSIKLEELNENDIEFDMPSEKFLIESIMAYIEKTNFPKQLQSKKMDLILDKYTTINNEFENKVKTISQMLTDKKENLNKLKSNNEKNLYNLKINII